MVLIEDLGYFQIQTVEEHESGDFRYKSVTCKSLQFALSDKTVDYINGIYNFWDALTNIDEHGEPTTLVGFISQLVPDWTITVDASLAGRYRSLDINSKSLLDFIYNDLEDAYQCIAEFDFLNCSIRFTDVNTLLNSPRNTGIYLSYANLMNDLSITEYCDEIKTRLYVYGQDLDIRSVNPLGTAYIINLDYYLTTEWMSQELIDKVIAWKAKLASYMNESDPNSYASKLTALQVLQNSLVTAQSTLLTKQGVLNSYLAVRDAQLGQGLSPSPELQANIATAQSEVAVAQSAINTLTSQINTAKSALVAINEDVALANNFTPDELLILDKYLIDGVYTNSNYVVTDQMTEADIQRYATELYNEGITVLGRMSRPRYTFSVNALNFMFLKTYEGFTNQLTPGCVINIENGSETIMYPILLEMSYSWDDLEAFSLSFGNRFRLNDTGYTYEDLISSAANTSGKLDVNWNSLLEFSRTYKTSVTDLINNALDVSLKDIISGANQDIVWNASGMTFRKYDPDTGAYDDKQFKIINNKMVFTDDNWNSVKSVIGEFPLTGGGTAYGIVGEAIVGNLIVGSNLTIANTNSHGETTLRVDGGGLSFSIHDEGVIKSFLLSDNGVDINNATLTLTRSLSGGINNTLTIDPTDGIKLSKSDGINTEDVFYLDSSGNVVMKGQITATSGSIGGWTISSDGLYHSNNAYYLKSDGTGRIGLMTFTNSSATFAGNIYANNLRTGTQIVDGMPYDAGYVNNSHIQDNSISPDKLYSSFTTGISTAISEVYTYTAANYATVGMLASYETVLGAESKYATIANVASIQATADAASAQIALVVGANKLVDGTSGNVNASIVMQAINGDSSTIKITADKIDFTGQATFLTAADIGVNGTTIINGSLIQTGSIAVERIQTSQVCGSIIGIAFGNSIGVGTAYIDRIYPHTGSTMNIGMPGNAIIMRGSFDFTNATVSGLTSTAVFAA